MITNNIPNGTILVSTRSHEPILVVSSNGLGHWGYSLNYGSCWLDPSDEVISFSPKYTIKYKWVCQAKLKLRDLFDNSFLSNLDYIEALDKINKYEKEKI